MEERDDRKTADEDVEGHGHTNVRDNVVRETDEDDDVEGHGHTNVRGAADDDDVEGHTLTR